MLARRLGLAFLGFAFGSVSFAAAAPGPLAPALTAPVTAPILVPESSAGSASDLVLDFGAPTKGTVVVFLSAECPCSRSHEAKLRRLAAEFGPRGFRFVAVHANADETAERGRAHFSAAALGFPVVRDPGKLADGFGALKTPHVFVVSPAKEVLFSGGVDDSKHAERAKREYLRDALTEIADGRAPATAEARTLGCLIKRPSP